MNPLRPQPASKSEPRSADSFDPDREPIEELADEFVARRRRGERATVDEYAERYPQLSDEIRELFPAVIAMEQLKRRAQHEYRPRTTDQEISVEQLGDFRVVSEVARGGMGIVYEAEQVTLGRRVAVKVLPRMALRSEKDIQRFHREAQTSAKLHHTNIVPVFGVGEQDGMHYIVMQFIQGVGLDEIRAELRRLVLDQHEQPDGETLSETARSNYAKRNAESLLRERLRRDSSSDGSQDSISSTVRLNESTLIDAVETTPAINSGETPEVLHQKPRIDAEFWRNVARIGLQAADALHYAHSHGTLHRDVKPGNLLLDGEGVVWVADFGLAKAVEQEDVTWTGDIVGTLGYMAPERFNGQCDERSDIYGLGLTLYELATFERAFEGRDRVDLMRRVAQGNLPMPRRQNASIPRDLETIIMKSVATDPNDRYQSGSALATDLQCFLEDRPIHARRAYPVELLVRWCRRNRAVAGLTAMVAVLLIVVSLVATMGYVRESRQRQRAEATSQLAVDALDKIYGQLAPDQLQPSAPQRPDDDDDASLIAVQTPVPLSKNVAQLLDSLLDFYDQISKQADDDQRVLMKSVMATRRVADIELRLGQHDASKAAYHRAIERAEQIDPSTPSVHLELARIYNGLGMVLVAQRDRDGAPEVHRRALASLQRAEPSAEHQYETARTHYLLHLALRPPWWRNDQDDDEPERAHERATSLSEAVRLLKHLTQQHAGVPEYRFLLAQCYLAMSESPASDLPDARRAGLDLLKMLIDAYPDVADYRYELGGAVFEPDYRRLWQAEGPWDAQTLADSETRVREALTVTSDIELTHPNIPQYLILKARLHYTLAKILAMQHRSDESREHFLEAIGSQESTIRIQGNFRAHVWLAWIKLQLCEMLIESGQTLLARQQLASIPAVLDKPDVETESRYAVRWSKRIRARVEQLDAQLSGV